jgi:hypothetical protein
MLNVDILLYIFGNFVCVTDIISLRQVSKQFYRLVSDRVVRYNIAVNIALRTLPPSNHKQHVQMIMLFTYHRYRYIFTNDSIRDALTTNPITASLTRTAITFSLVNGSITYPLQDCELVCSSTNCTYYTFNLTRINTLNKNGMLSLMILVTDDTIYVIECYGFGYMTQKCTRSYT